MCVYIYIYNTFVLEEHGLDAARDMGLRVSLSFRTAHFFAGKRLTTPSVPFDRLDDVISVWCQTAGRFPSVKYRERFGPRRTFFHVYDPVTAADMWSAIRQSYTDIWAAAGRDARHMADWLDADYAAHRAHRERQLETWNMLRMTQEERHRLDRVKRRRLSERRHEEQRERRAMASEDRHISLRAERRLQRQECRAMASEDRRRRLRRTPQQIAEELDSRLLRRVSQWLRRLGQVEQAERQLERKAAAARAKESRQALATAKRGRCQEEAVERAAQRARREERWRWMNRRDITIGEMLRESAQA